MSASLPLDYLPPAERMALIRKAAPKVPGRDETRVDGIGPTARQTLWVSLGILGAPGMIGMFRDDLQVFYERIGTSHDDWRERCKRKRYVCKRFKRIVRERSGDRCHYCFNPVPRKFLMIDHVVPSSRGGRSVLDNLVGACHACNADKCDLLLEEWPAYQRRLADLLHRWYQVADIVDVETGNSVLF